MRTLPLYLAFVLLLATPSWGRDNVPDPELTPGEVMSTNVDVVCQHGYSATVRHTTQEMKRNAYRTYHVRGSHKHWKIDHLVPLCIGGADTMKNIWPSDFKAGKYNAAAKDRLELKIHKMVCSREMPIMEGQQLFLTNWQTAYDRYCPNRAACPSYEEIKAKTEKD